MKKEEEIKCWILLSLSTSKEHKGLSFVDIYEFPTPSNFQLDYPKIIRYIREYEKNRLVKSSRTIDERFTLTDKGKKELRRILRLNKADAQKIINCFPEIELRRKLENIEIFIFGTVLMITSYLMLEKQATSNIYLKYILIAVLFFSFGLAGSSMLSIFSSVTKKLKISLLTRFLDFLEDYKDRVGYILIILANVVGYFVLTTYLDYTPKQIGGIVTVEILIGIWVKYRNIIDFFKKKKWIKD